MLCIDNCGARELKALHLLPQNDDQNNFPQSGITAQRLPWLTLEVVKNGVVNELVFVSKNVRKPRRRLSLAGRPIQSPMDQ